MNSKLFKTILKVIPYFIIIVLLATALIQGSVLSQKKAKVKTLTEMLDEANKKNSELENLNGISVEVEFQIKTTNILSFNANNCSVIAREIAQMTRKEVLDSLKNKNNEDGTIQPKQKK